MGKCVECGKKGDWLTICPSCFISAMIDVDDEQTTLDDEREIHCTIIGCDAKFKSYEDFAKHIHLFHGIDEM